jgi:hypothetical protein
MDVKVSQLRAATERLLAHLESKRDSVQLDVDYYWSIPAQQRYDPYAEPREFTMGQLSDDWMEVEKIAKGEAEPIGYALTWLATILSAVGEKVIE